MSVEVMAWNVLDGYGEEETARPVAEALPNAEPGEASGKLARIGSLATRAADMAQGDVMRRFTAAGLVDADEYHQGTMPARAPLMQLDHIMHTDNIRKLGFHVLPRTDMSDHRGIAASLSIRG